MKPYLYTIIIFTSLIISCQPFLPIEAQFECPHYILDKRDNQTYSTVKIGEQCWMAENLNYGAYHPANQISAPSSVIGQRLVGIMRSFYVMLLGDYIPLKI